MSEPRRWNLVAEGLILAVSGGPSVSLQEAEKGIPVIEAEPVLSRIKELEAHLKEANEVVAFYADRDNWTEGNPQKCCAMIGPDDHDAESGTAPYYAGRKARAYLEKWKGKK